MGLTNHVPTNLADVGRPQPLSDRWPPFPGGRPWPSECAAATIPAAPARLLVVSFARSRRCSHRRRVIALTSELTSWFSGLSLAGFEVTLYGRFWVTPEVPKCLPWPVLRPLATWCEWRGRGACWSVLRPPAMGR